MREGAEEQYRSWQKHSSRILWRGALTSPGKMRMQFRRRNLRKNRRRDAVGINPAAFFALPWDQLKMGLNSWNRLDRRVPQSSLGFGKSGVNGVDRIGSFFAFQNFS